jgi:hypothetical protein
MSIDQLPPVAKSFFTFCKKCDADRYHRVLAHTTPNSAKMKCEVCAATRTYNLAKENAAATAKTPRGPTAASSARKAVSENAKRSTHTAEYEKLLQTSSSQSEQSYNMRLKFEKNQKIAHPKFGLGVIKECFPEKIEIVFKDEVRSLVHNRS